MNMNAGNSPFSTGWTIQVAMPALTGGRNVAPMGSCGTGTPMLPCQLATVSNALTRKIADSNEHWCEACFAGAFLG